MTQWMGDANGKNQDSKQVVDFNEVREQRLEEKRKHTERIFFKNLLSVYSVAGRTKMYPIELIEISEDGCSFQILYDPERVWPKDSDEIPIRLYFSQETYLEIFVKILHSRPSIDRNARYTRYGCVVDKGVKSYPAYQLFVGFLKSYAEHAHKDMGDVSVFYL